MSEDLSDEEAEVKRYKCYVRSGKREDLTNYARRKLKRTLEENNCDQQVS